MCKILYCLFFIVLLGCATTEETDRTFENPSIMKPLHNPAGAPDGDASQIRSDSNNSSCNTPCLK